MSSPEPASPAPPSPIVVASSNSPHPTTSGKATAILALGIISLILGVIPAIVALALTPSARRAIHTSNGQLTGAAFITAGVICAWVAVAATVIITSVFVVPFLMSGGWKLVIA